MKKKSDNDLIRVGDIKGIIERYRDALPLSCYYSEIEKASIRGFLKIVEGEIHELPTIEQPKQRACADGDYLNRETVVNNVLSQLAVSQNSAAMRERIMNLQGISIEQPQWISVDDRLPQEDEPLENLCKIVQVLLKDGTVTVGFCNRSLKIWAHIPVNDMYFRGEDYAETSVVAWKPLSQPPKEGIKDDNI